MKNFLKQVGANLTALTLFFVLLAVAFSSSVLLNLKKNIVPVTQTHQKLVPNSILHITLEGELVEYKKNALSTGFSLAGLRYALEQAAQDEDIRGVFIELTSHFNAKGYAHLDTIRKYIKNFQKSGKPVHIYSESYTLPFVATFASADNLTLHPVGRVNLQGPYGMLFYRKKVLERLGITPFVFQSGKNKNHGEEYVKDKPSVETQKSMLDIYKFLYNDSLKKVEQAKHMPKGTIHQINIDHAFLNPKQACQYKIINSIGAKQEALEAFKASFNFQPDKKNTVNEISLTAYVKEKQQAQTQRNEEAKILVLSLEGDITDGKSSENNISSEKVVPIIKKYTEDKSYKGLVIIVNSRGGDVMACEKIQYEIIQICKAKPVVALIRNMGASAGYAIIMNAHHIVAHEQSIVGSIGTVSIGFDISKLMKKMGVHVETIKTSPNSSNVYEALNEKTKAAYQAFNKYMAQRFKNSVLKARKGKIDPKVLDEFADGRVEFGEKAKAIGLIDEIGDLDTSLEKAAELADLKPGKYTVYYHKEPIYLQNILVQQFVSAAT
ncbi:MAG: S49 family peptidase [Bacteroidota bacterium]